MFLDDLLTSYQQIESRFGQNLYHFYKSLEFRLLWDVRDRLAGFQRLAVESAKGNGNLQGVVELTNAMEEIDTIHSKALRCFSRMHYAVDTRKWSFDIIKDKVVRHEILLLCLFLVFGS